MILGVLVALLIVFTLWMRTPDGKQATMPIEIEGPEAPKPAIPSAVVKISAQVYGFVKTHF